MEKTNEQLLSEIEISLEVIVEENSSLKKELAELKANSPSEEIQSLKEKIAKLEKEKSEFQKNEIIYRDKLNKLKSLTEGVKKTEPPSPEPALEKKAENPFLEEKQFDNKEASLSSSEKKWDDEKHANFFDKDSSKNQDDYNILDSEKNPFAAEDTMLSDDEFSKNQ